MADDLRRLAAGLFVVGFPGREPPPATAALLEAGVAGVVYFARNVAGAGQLARLTADLQRRSDNASLLLAADEEGGIVSRLPRGPARMPGAMALGAAGDPALARRVGLSVAAQLRAVGVNMDLAPVLDVGAVDGAIGVRAFGDDATVVATVGTAWLRGLQDGGVMAVAKHFPGIGRSRVDSHVARPVLDAPADALEPFRAAVAAGVACVMVGHAAVPSADPSGAPASRSPAVIAGLLRGELGHAGLVMTDCLEMLGAVADASVAEAAVAAIAAGADLVLISHTPELQAAAVEAVASALADGRIPVARAEEARERIAAAGQRFGLASRGLPDPDAAPHLLDRPSDRALAREVAERALTAVAPGSLPGSARPLVVDCGVALGEALAAGRAALEAALAPARAAPPVAPGVPAGEAPAGHGVTPQEAAAAPGAAPPVAPGVPAGEAPAGHGVTAEEALAAPGAASQGSPHATTPLAVGLGRWYDPADLARLAATGRPIYAWSVTPAGARDALAAGARAVWLGYDDAPASLAVAADALLGRLAGAGRLPVRL